MLRTNLSCKTLSCSTAAPSSARVSSRLTASKSVGYRWATAAVLAVGLLSGCKNQQKCDEALKTARQALQDDYLDFALARQWREHAGKICGVGPELSTLDQEILAKEAAVAKAATDKAAAEKAAGEKAIEESKSLWKSFDELEKEAKDLKALKKTYNQAKKLMLGLPLVYAEQVKAYNEKQYDKRKTKLEKEAEAAKK
jgi:hypothetical protein